MIINSAQVEVIERERGQIAELGLSGLLGRVALCDCLRIIIGTQGPVEGIALCLRGRSVGGLIGP